MAARRALHAPFFFDRFNFLILRILLRKVKKKKASLAWVTFFLLLIVEYFAVNSRRSIRLIEAPIKMVSCFCT
ncbi:hypothetical protein EDC94DRAFT_649596 [Helicostylum pulchrum]|nr:hypothetical protein EDC94DRAFT_649596 [Helicostylum pulchrum]